MLSRDSNYINMVMAVRDVLKKYPEDLKNRKGLLKKIELLNSTLEIALVYQAAAEKDSEGVTESKENARTQAINLGFILAGRAYEFAEEEKNPKLMGQFNLPKRDLANAQGVITVARLEALANDLKPLIGKMDDYDVTENELHALVTATSNYKIQLAGPREATVVVKSNNDWVKEKVTELKKHMRSIKNLMTKLDGTDCYRQYQIARIVIDLGTRKPKGTKKKEDDKKPAVDTPDDKKSKE